MRTFGQKENGVSINALRDVYAGALADVIEEKRVPLDARRIIPRITNLDGIDVATRHLVFVKYAYDGTAIITDLRPKTLPTIHADAASATVPLKWISIGIETDVNELDDIRTGKVYPVNRTEQAFRIVAEQENKFLLDGFEKLGLDGLNDLETAEGIHVVAASKKWAESTGEEIIEDLRKMRVAMITGKKFTARTLNLPQELDFILDKVYTDSNGTATSDAKTIREVLLARKYFDRIESVIGITAPLLLDDIPSNMGFVDVQPLTIGKEYEEGRSTITPIEEKVSPFILLQPESVVKLTGTV